MAHYYDTEYDLLEEKQKAQESLTFFQSQLDEIHAFLLAIQHPSIPVPEHVQSHLNKLVRRYEGYIREKKEKVDKATHLLAKGKRYVGWGQW